MQSNSRRRRQPRTEDAMRPPSPTSRHASASALLQPIVLPAPLLLLQVLLLFFPRANAFLQPPLPPSSSSLSSSPTFISPTMLIAPTTIRWRGWPALSSSPTSSNPPHATSPSVAEDMKLRVEASAATLTAVVDHGEEADASLPPPVTALVGSKEELFDALQSHTSRREAFEGLWNSEFEFTEAEYQELLKACFRLGYVNPFKDLVDEVQRLGVPVALETWTACIYIASSRDFFRLGIACLEKMVECGAIPDGKAFNQVMACCEKKGRGEEAMHLFNFMRGHGIEAPPLTYWALASLLSCEGRWDDFKIVEGDLRARDFPESIKERFYSTAVVARSGARDWQGALGMLRRMHECGAVPSIRGFTTALSTCMAAGAYQAVRDFVEEVRGWAIFEFDVATYNVVINSYASERDLEGASTWFQKIYEAGLRPSLISYSTIFKVCASMKRGDLAKEYLERLVSEGDIHPNLITLNHAIQALAVSRSHMGDARELLETMRDRFGVAPNATAYNFLLRAAGEKGDARLAMELYHRMKRVDGLVPEPRTIWEATIACTKNRFFAPMEELADDLMALSADAPEGEDVQRQQQQQEGGFKYMGRERGRREGQAQGQGGYDSVRSLLYAYNAVLTALEKDGDGKLALRVYAHMQAQGLQADLMAIARLLEALNKGKMPERGLKIWSELEGRRAEVRENVNITNAVLHAMSSADPLSAVEFFQDLRGKGQVDDRSYSFAFAAYDNLGDVAGVRRLWSEMRTLGLAFDRVSYGSLLRALANAGEIDQAMDGLRRSEEVGVPLNNYTVALTLIGCKRSRRWSTALSMLRELRDEKGLSLNVVCYNSVLTVCNAAGQWRACLKLLEEMKEHDVGPDYTSLRVTLNALASAGRNNEIVHLYRQHEQEGGVLSRKLDNFAFRLIANAFIKSDPVAAVGMIQNYLATFEGGGGGGRQGATGVFSSSSPQPSRRYHQQHHNGPPLPTGSPQQQHHKQQQQLQQPPLIDSRLYKTLITALGYKGEWSQALGVLKSLPPILRDISTVSAAASALLRSEEYIRARDLLVEAEASSSSSSGGGGGGQSMRFDSIADSLGLQAAYMADDFAQAQIYLDRLSKDGSHANSSVNFGSCLLAKQGKWPELASLLSHIVNIQQQGGKEGRKEGGKKFVVSRTTLETFASLTSTTTTAGGREGGVVVQQPEPAVLTEIVGMLNKMKGPDNCSAVPLGGRGGGGGVGGGAPALVAVDGKEDDRIGGARAIRPE